MPARRAPTLPADPAAARVHLLDVAEACFERYGIKRTSMEDIAAQARVSRPTLYRYFGDRDSLVRTIAQRRAASFAGTMRGFLARYTSLEDQLVEGLLHLGAIGRRDQFFGRMLTPDVLGEAHEILMNSDTAIDFAAEVWGPVLTAARQRGELADTVRFPAVYRWLTSVNILLIGWMDGDGDGDGEAVAQHREMLRSFVLPAFVRTRH